MSKPAARVDLQSRDTVYIETTLSERLYLCAVLRAYAKDMALPVWEDRMVKNLVDKLKPGNLTMDKDTLIAIGCLLFLFVVVVTYH